jgi:hypothetical protein
MLNCYIDNLNIVTYRLLFYISGEKNLKNLIDHFQQSVEGQINEAIFNIDKGDMSLLKHRIKKNFGA